MALKDYQTALALDTLYEVTLKGRISGSEQLQPNVYVNSGTVNIYGSNSATQPVSLATMTLETENTGIDGIEAFSVIPRWVAFVQNTGTTTELVSSGLSITSKGAIA